MSRFPLVIVVLLAAGFFVAIGSGQTKIPLPTLPEKEKAPQGVDPKMPYFQVCAKECDDCARLCGTCTAHCTNMLADGKKEHLEPLQLCQDCAAICAAASRVVAKDGPLSEVICTACAEACKRCGDACEKHSGDGVMKQCAEQCRKCEKACRAMLKGGK